MHHVVTGPALLAAVELGSAVAVEVEQSPDLGIVVELIQVGDAVLISHRLGDQQTLETAAANTAPTFVRWSPTSEPSGSSGAHHASWPGYQLLAQKSTSP